MSVTAIIVAAGRGTRAGGVTPKQFHDLRGRPVLERTLSRFATHVRIDQIILVANPSDAHLLEPICARMPELVVVDGGETRTGSVLAGLSAATSDHVLIHDGARPLVSDEIIDAVIDALSVSDAAAPGLPVTDALWFGAESKVTGLQSRAGLYRAQTPQGFRKSALMQAYAAQEVPALDDVAVARAAGIDVAIVPGEERNLKITLPEDFDRAARLLENDDMDIRLGNGYDVHKFGPGDAVTLCGIEIAHDQGLVGHSDADVGMHAITDALYGALGEGDIGQHFPPSDPQWKGAASDIFLKHAAQRVAAHGFQISNVDCTLVCEAPKIGPHSLAMRSRIAEILGIERTRVSVKATTSEELGFTGRREGIASIATAALIKS